MTTWHDVINSIPVSSHSSPHRPRCPRFASSPPSSSTSRLRCALFLKSPRSSRSLTASDDQYATQCPNGANCPGTQTCCANGSGGYGCCPYTNAVCCSDHTHCCPSGTVCDVKEGTCNRPVSTSTGSGTSTSTSTLGITGARTTSAASIEAAAATIDSRSTTTAAALETVATGPINSDTTSVQALTTTAAARATTAETSVRPSGP